jgi:hypothetical protein
MWWTYYRPYNRRFKTETGAKWSLLILVALVKKEGCRWAASRTKTAIKKDSMWSAYPPQQGGHLAISRYILSCHNSESGRCDWGTQWAEDRDALLDIPKWKRHTHMYVYTYKLCSPKYQYNSRAKVRKPVL